MVVAKLLGGGMLFGFWTRSITAGVVSFGGLAYSTLAAIDPHQITTWVGAVSLSIASSIGVLTTAWIVAKKKIDEANEASLSGQLAKVSAQLNESNENQKRVRSSLHEISSQAHGERLKHVEEVDRLIRLSEATQESFDHMADENRMLRDEILALRAQIERLNAQLLEFSRTSVEASERADASAHIASNAAERVAASTLETAKTLAQIKITGEATDTHVNSQHGAMLQTVAVALRTVANLSPGDQRAIEAAERAETVLAKYEEEQARVDAEQETNREVGEPTA